MIDIGSTDFYISVSSLPRDQFESYSNSLFDIWDSHVTDKLPLEDYSLNLEVEEGSIKGAGKVMAGLGAIYAGICGYGSFVQGIQTIRSHVVAAGDYLSEQAHCSLGGNAPAPVIKRHGGALGQLHRLFDKVQRREMSVEEATQMASRIIGEDASTSPDFMERLNISLKEAPRLPLQTDLPLDILTAETAPEQGSQNRIPHPLRPKPVAAPANQLRVEIRRDSKNGKKVVRVIEL